MPRLARLFLVFSALIGSAVQAQPFLVEDIWSSSISARWDLTPRFAEVGGIVYFTAQDGVHGTELWRSDGTAAGTWLVKDLCAGICSSAVSWMDAAGGALYFGANDGFHGPALWKSDGTAAGTVPVREGVEVHDTIGEVGGVLLFVGSLPGGSKDLWRSDGTQAGTVSLSASASDPAPLGYAGSLLLFSAKDPEHGRELWKTDGTAAGTAFVEDLTPGTDTSFSGFRPFHRKFFPAVGGRLFFPAGPRLWVSDGTPEGTYQAADVPLMTTYETSYLAALGDAVYFSGHDPEHGFELWRTDATDAGTFRVKDLNPGTGGSYPTELVEAGGSLYFRAVSNLDPDLWTLWKSDGTEEGTVLVKPGAVLNLVYDYSALMALGTGVVFFASDGALGDEPWYSDGTDAGTQMLADLYPGSVSSYGGSFFFPLNRIDGGVVTGGQWLFRARTPAGWTLWKSNGTPAGTQLVKQMDDAQGSGLPPSPEMIDLDGTLLFSANDGSTGRELWRSDGTVPGTSLVIDLLPGARWSGPADLTAFGGLLYFTAWPQNLMRTDGTEAGTELVGGSFRRELVVAGSGLYYVCSGGFNDGVCRADGPFIQTIWSPFISAASQLTPAGSNLFFNGATADDEELWKTGGVPGDAVMLDIFHVFPGLGSSKPRFITGFGSSVFLSAYDDSAGRELWFSDGTNPGTRRVKDIVPGPGSSDPRSIVKAGNLVFFVADDGTSGAELWRSDGTAAGTFRVKDIRPGPQSSMIQGLTAYGDIVVFAADDGVNGQELWVSYGSLDAAFMVKDIRPGPASSFPGAFRVVGHTVLFAADDGTHGLEPWRTDGFAAGTFLVHDVFTGPEPSSPAGFTLSGDYLYFTANDGAHGFELWALDRAELGSALAATKRVMSPTYPGGPVTYEIVITNTGAGPLPDNPGDEMGDTLPAGLTLTAASADVGAVTLDLPNNRVAWNGALGLGESATVLVHATLSASAIEYSMIFNQATVNYDSDGDGASEKTGVSSDPGRGLEEPTLATVSTPPLAFHTITPCRVLDTRTSTPLSAGVKRTFAIAGTCGIPPTAKAVSANLTALGATGSGHLVLHPAGIPHSVPITSSVSFKAVRAMANNAMLPLASGAVDATAAVVGGGTVHLVLDVNGYYE